MTYKLNLTLTTESKSELMRMKGQKIEKIIRDDFGGWSILIGLDNGNERTFIRNNADAHPEYRDESTQFVVSRSCDLDFGRTIVCPVEKRINTVQLITDHVAWRHGGDMWEADADVGILLTFDEDEEILIEAVDSIAGFMRYCQGKDCLKRLRSIEEQWQMKTDRLYEARRQIENL